MSKYQVGDKVWAISLSPKVAIVQTKIIGMNVQRGEIIDVGTRTTIGDKMIYSLECYEGLCYDCEEDDFFDTKEELIEHLVTGASSSSEEKERLRSLFGKK